MTHSNRTAFSDDALDRRGFAEGIYKLMLSLDKGVIAIDGDWGVGKTWFGRNLKTHIENQHEYHVIWIDAFEADWVDDPALTLIASIGTVLEGGERNKFFESVAPLVSKAIPSIAKMAVKAASNVIGIDNDLIDSAGDLLKDESEILIQKKLNELASRKKSLQFLKDSIANQIGATELKKIIIFIDELDRCSPAYAIRLLERLKHLFEMNGVIFILLWNRQQIKQAVEAFYGAGTDGVMYLDKFVDYPLRLSISTDGTTPFPMARFIQKTGSELKSTHSRRFQSNEEWLSAISYLLDLNARQVERISNWWVMSNTRRFVFLETWLLGLKAKYPIIYEGIRQKDAEAHRSAITLLGRADKDHQTFHVAEILLRLHNSYAHGIFDENDNDIRQFFSNLGVSPLNSIRVALRHLEETFD